MKFLWALPIPNHAEPSTFSPIWQFSLQHDKKIMIMMIVMIVVAKRNPGVQEVPKCRGSRQGGPTNNG